jgi:hypothetical protein
MSMPWDRFKPEAEEAEEPEFPYTPTEPTEPEPEPTPNVPATQGEINFGRILKDAFVEALRESQSELRESATDFAQEAIRATVAGKSIDWENPTIVAETEKGKQLVVADARSRSWRTLLQGLGIDVTFAIVAVLSTLTNLDLMQKETWIILGALLIKTIVQTVVAYFMRLKVTPTVRTPGEKMALVPLPVEIPQEESKETRREGN